MAVDYTVAMQFICILGRQPALGRAELESRFGADALQSIQPDIVLLSCETPPNFNTFGGILKVALTFEEIPTDSWPKINRHIENGVKQLIPLLPEGKIQLGISAYYLPINASKLNAAALSLKKTIKQAGRSVRIIPNKEPALNTAQVLHNKLTKPTGLEIVAVKASSPSVFLGKTIWVQDIEAYSKRDQGRPKRDSRVGMLPPKLAQIILNLAAGTDTSTAMNPKTVLDPFCGTGVLLQEAALSGYDVYGTDLEPRMIEYTKTNFDWLNTVFSISSKGRFEIGDATDHQWSQPFDTVACESYLGRPFSHTPDLQILKEVMQTCNLIHKKFFQNLAKQTPRGFRLCIGVPAWRTKSDFTHLPVLDHLEEIGYNRVSFVHAQAKDLIYHRADQYVARELVVLERI